MGKKDHFLVIFHLGVNSHVDVKCCFSSEKQESYGHKRGRDEHLMNASYVPRRSTLGALTELNLI